jgi:hypothetical protein
MTPEEKLAIPTELRNRNLAENKGKGKGRKDGYQTDQSQTGADDTGTGFKRWTRATGDGEGEGKPAGKGARPCRFIEQNRTCPRGTDCYSYWSHPPAAKTGVDIASMVKQTTSPRASASDGGAVAWTEVKPTTNKP